MSRFLLSYQTLTSSRCLACTLSGSQYRAKHSSTQVKRLFKNNPARARVESRKGIERIPEPLGPPKFPPLVDNVKILYNGWSMPVQGVDMPEYPFQIRRTRNKPGDAVGFLPVYSKFRKDGTKGTTLVKKVTGDRETFLKELRAVLQMPKPNNPRDDKIKVRAGGTIEVDGNHVRNVKEWLTGLGF